MSPFESLYVAGVGHLVQYGVDAEAIFAAAAVLEVALAGLCIRTSSPQTRVRSWVRIAAAVGFLVCVVLGIPGWSFRYYALAVLLSVLAVRGVVVLARHPRAERRYSTAQVTRRAMGMLMLILLAALPAIVFPHFRPLATTGRYQVATVRYTLTDPHRIETYTATGEPRRLNVELWFPKNATGRYPLIVFSPGSLGTRASNVSLYDELASHGYVVIAIDHTYESLATTDDAGHTTFIDPGYVREVMKVDVHANKEQAFHIFTRWMTIRMGDINFVIDHTVAEARGNSLETAYQRVDPTRIGVMGHSLGGSAALGIGRVRSDVGAVIALEAPFMYDIIRVQDDEFVFREGVYPVPVLNVYSSDSWSHLHEWAQYAENARLLAPSAATAFTVDIKGTGHLSLTDLALVSPILTRLLNREKSTIDARYALEVVNRVSLDFFDAYLKGKGGFTSAGTYPPQ